MIEDSELEDQAPDLIAAYKPKRNIRKPACFSDIFVTYALPVEVMEDNVPSTFREAELSSESELWRKAMVEGLSFSLSMTHGNSQSYLKRRRPLDAIGLCKERRMTGW